jgi:hypothetical protein
MVSSSGTEESSNDDYDIRKEANKDNTDKVNEKNKFKPINITNK